MTLQNKPEVRCGVSIETDSIEIPVRVGLKEIIEELAQIYHATFEDMAASLLKEQVDSLLSNEPELGQAYAKHLRFKHNFKAREKPE